MFNPLTIRLRGTSIPHFDIWKELHRIYIARHKVVSWDLVCDLEIIESFLKNGHTGFTWGMYEDCDQTDIGANVSEAPNKEIYKIAIDREGSILRSATITRVTSIKE